MKKPGLITATVTLGIMLTVHVNNSWAEPPVTDAGARYRVRIHTDHGRTLAEELERAGYDILCGGAQENGVELVATGAELEELRELDFPIDILERSRPLREKLAERRDGELDIDPEYPDPAEVLQAMQDAAAAYPDICQFVDLTAHYGLDPTFEGRHLYAVKISDNVGTDENEPSMLVVSNHHAREIVTPVIALYAIAQLTEGYGVNPQVTDAVDSHEIWIAPIWNPDGYDYVWNVDNMWRKNRHVFNDGVGVDQNRNYPLGWDSECSGSTRRSSETYKGEFPASEPETQTMLVWSRDRRFAKVLDYHSYGREALYGYRCLDHPLDSYWMEKVYDLADASGYFGNSRPPSASGQHYQTQFGHFAALSSLVETHEEFQPTYESALEEAARVWPGILWMLDQPVPVGGNVVDAQTGEAVSAQVNVEGLAFTNGEQNTSESRFGKYHAFLPPDFWEIEFSHDEYVRQVWNVEVAEDQSTALDIALEPALFRFVLPEGALTRIEPRGSLVPVDIIELVEGGFVPDSAEVRVFADGNEIVAPLIPLGSSQFVAIFPPLPCDERVSYYFAGVNANGVEITEPALAPGETYSAIVATDATTAFVDDFESDTGWLVENLGASDGQWSRGVPVSDNSYPYDPESDGDGSGRCYLTANRSGDSDVDNGSVRLTSPSFDLAAGPGEIRYLKFLRAVRPDMNDGLAVEVSPDGNSDSWTMLHAYGNDQGPDWQEHAITTEDLTDAGVPITNTMHFRLTASDGGQDSTIEAGLDGFLAQTFSCRAQPWLDVDALIPGENADFIVQGHPNTRYYLAYSLAGYGPTPIPPLGVMLDIANPKQLGTMMRSDNSGLASWTFTVLDRTGLEVWFQVAQPGDVSNVVVRKIQ